MCVIAVAFTSLFGVLPVALQNYRHSMSLSMVANVMSQVSAELQQTSASDILSNSTGTAPLPDRYFNDEGQEVTLTNTKSPPVFHVKYEPITYTSNAGTGSLVQKVASVNTAIMGGSNPSTTTALIPVKVDIYSIHGGVDTATPLASKTLFIPNYN